jgi:hypothetical protein
LLKYDRSPGAASANFTAFVRLATGVVKGVAEAGESASLVPFLLRVWFWAKFARQNASAVGSGRDKQK